MDWYTKSRQSVQAHFPDNPDLFLAMLAVTSVNATVKVNVTLAMKAYAQHERGVPFTGYLGTVIANLERAVQGEALQGPKVSAFYAALQGDKNAVVVDRWMARAYGFAKVSSSNYATIERSIRLEARLNRMSPSDFQAWLWADVRGAGEDFGEIIDKRKAQKRLF